MGACCGGGKKMPDIDEDMEAENEVVENIFEVGDEVVLRNFADKPEYEGRQGFIVKPFNEDKGRWPVRLNYNNKLVNVLPKCLILETSVTFKPKRELLLRIAAKLPTELDEFSEDNEEREQWFEGMDGNGSGRLSLAEIDLGVKNFLEEECFLMKPAIREAYKASKDIGYSYNEEEEHFVDKSEFRMLLVNLKKYIEIYAAFEEIDAGDDDRIDFNEFSSKLEFLHDYGLTHVTDENAQEVFDSIDKNSGGQILFDEFAQWVLHSNMIKSLQMHE